MTREPPGVTPRTRRGDMGALKLSIVVPTRNRRDLLRRTLPTLLHQDLPSDEYEVVLVSDGSNDGTVDYLATIVAPVALRVLDRPRGGLARARNAGIAAARGDVILLMDDDMLCRPTLAREHLAAHVGGASRVACGPTLTAPESRPGLATEYARAWYDAYATRLTHEGHARSEYDVWVTSNCSAPRALLLAHGGYDEQFLYSEDAELAIRLWRAGVPFRFLPTAAAHEVYSKSASDVAHADAPRLGVSELQLCRKFPEYTPRSLLSSVVGRSRAKVFISWACATSVVSPDLVLAPPLWALERLRRVGVMQRLGMRLLGKRMAAAALRSASHHAGSWAALRRELKAHAAAAAGPRASSHPGVQAPLP